MEKHNFLIKISLLKNGLKKSTNESYSQRPELEKTKLFRFY